MDELLVLQLDQLEGDMALLAFLCPQKHLHTVIDALIGPLLKGHSSDYHRRCVCRSPRISQSKVSLCERNTHAVSSLLALVKLY